MLEIIVSARKATVQFGSIPLLTKSVVSVDNIVKLSTTLLNDIVAPWYLMRKFLNELAMLNKIRFMKNTTLLFMSRMTTDTHSIIYFTSLQFEFKADGS